MNFLTDIGENKFVLQRNADDQTLYGILVQNAETVALVCPQKGLLSPSEIRFLISRLIYFLPSHNVLQL